MENAEILGLLDSAIQQVIKDDKYLLVNDLYERSISHKLAMYIEPLFKDKGYDVDCEYNGDVDSDSKRKAIGLLKDELEAIKMKLTDDEKADAENPLTERAVYPDIIIHKRGTNEKNLSIIEIKKSSSGKIKCEFDELKLKAYTSDYAGNHLNYQLGVYINFGVEKEYPKYGMKLFENGNENK